MTRLDELRAEVKRRCAAECNQANAVALISSMAMLIAHLEHELQVCQAALDVTGAASDGQHEGEA
jgi:hypothetical protein